MRAPFQVLVVPYRRTQAEPELLVLRRSDTEIWQFAAGGGEEGESPQRAAQRELVEETAITAPVTQLDTVNSVPVVNVVGSLRWGVEHLVLREWAFAADAEHASLQLSGEHTEYRWVPAMKAADLLRWDSNVTAAWETRERLTRGLL